MKRYQHLKIENQYNVENIEKIEAAAAEAIDYAAKYYEHAVEHTTLTDEGFIRLTFAEGQDISKDDMREATEEAQRNFDEKFGELIRMEYSELL